MDWVRSRIVHPRSGVSVGGVSGLEGEGDLAVHNNKYLDLYRTRGDGTVLMIRCSSLGKLSAKTPFP